MSKKSIPVASIDTGVPIPDRASYPIRKLKVGESFLFPANKRSSVQSLASKVKAETGNDYTIKKMDGDTCRLWRIS